MISHTVNGGEGSPNVQMIAGISADFPVTAWQIEKSS